MHENWVYPRKCREWNWSAFYKTHTSVSISAEQSQQPRSWSVSFAVGPNNFVPVSPSFVLYVSFSTLNSTCMVRYYKFRYDSINKQWFNWVSKSCDLIKDHIIIRISQIFGNRPQVKILLLAFCVIRMAFGEF